MKIEIVKASDLEEILKLQYLAYQSEAMLLNNYSIAPLKQTIEEVKKEFDNGIILKAVNDDEIIIGSVRGCLKNVTVFVGKLIVRPDYQGQGIGTSLLQEMEKVCSAKRYELFTSSKSLKNIKLYERAGYKTFKEVEVNKDLKMIYLQKFI